MENVQKDYDLTESSFKAFISYAHMDNEQEFVRRLAFALDLIIDVYWDRKLGQGNWDDNLMSEIEDRDYFIVVMTENYRHRPVCLQELQRAIDNGKVLLPIKVRNFEDMDLFPDGEKTNYADFTISFTNGFQKLTYMITGVEIVPWEHLSETSVSDLKQALSEGNIPGLISLELADWIVVQYLWTHFEQNIKQSEHARRYPIFSPKTPSDIYRTVKLIFDTVKQLIQEAGPKGFYLYSRDYNLSKDCFERIETIINKRQHLRDNEHLRCAKYLLDTFSSVDDYIVKFYSTRGKFGPAFDHRVVYEFNVFSYLRSLIAYHARRSRYLY